MITEVKDMREPFADIGYPGSTKRPMRVLLIINNLIYGGAETQVIALSRGLAARGHEVMIHTLRPDNPRAQDLSGSGVQVVTARKRWKFDPSLVFTIREAIAAFKPDIIHGFLPEGNLYARLAGIRTGVPTLNSERNDNYRLPWKYHAALKLTRAMAVGVVANSHSGARFARKQFGFAPDRVHVVWNGLDVAALDNAGASPVDPHTHFFNSKDVKVATLVGMVRPQKDYLLALRVAQALYKTDPKWRVLLVGDCLPHTKDYNDSVRRAWRELDLKDIVVFAGLRKDAVDIVRRSSVLFSTSLYEGCPNVILEAMAVGTPAVSTEYSDIRLILPNPWQVIPHRNAQALAEAIVRADRERSDVSTRQRAWIDTNATLSMAVARLEDVYRRYAKGAVSRNPVSSELRGPTCVSL
jgi:glycosyltransferase involved in cell wall biosynthesis